MKILFLPNWTVNYLYEDRKELQAPDKYIQGQKYWFFKYFPDDTIVDIIDIHKNNILHGIEKKIKFYIYQAFLAYRVMKNYDIVISHGAQSGIVLALLRLILGQGETKHLIFDIGGMNGGKAQGLSTYLIQIAMRSRPFIIAHSSIILDNIKNTYPILLDRTVFIPFGVDINQYPLCDVTKIKKYIFVFSGKNRDTDTVYEAWQTLTQKGLNKDFSIYFIGTDDIEKYKGDNIICIKRLKYDKYIELLAVSSFVILPLPYKKHSYGQMSLLGSLCLGKHVIATDCPGIDDYMHDCDSIKIVQPSNILQMEQAIINYMDKCDSLMDIYSSRKYVNEYFSERLMSKRIFEYIVSNILNNLN